MAGAPHPRMHGITHVAGGPDPIPGLPGVTVVAGFEQIVALYSPVGIWKLDETTGTTAFDSSGNGNDMTLRSGTYIGPTWGQAAGPPGILTAKGTHEPSSSDVGTALNCTLPSALTDNFSAGAWVKCPAGGVVGEIIGCGTSYHTNNGWALYMADTVNLIFLPDGGTPTYADAPPAANTWYLVGFTREAGVATLYVDGDAQASTSSVTVSANTSAWLFNDGLASLGNHGSDNYMSWAFITADPIPAASWAAMYANPGGPTSPDEGLVWTVDSAGRPSWQPPTIEVEY